jgi:membrane-bound serine protease (ClpP class)
MTLIVAQEAASQTFLLWGFILLGAAIVLGVLELFVPSGGLIAALAGVCVIGSITAFFMYDRMGGFVALSLYVILTPILLWALFKYWITSPLARNMILGGSDFAINAEEDPFAASERARQERLAELRALIGAEGTAVTPMRPIGVIKIEGRRIDAMAESGSIDAGTPIIVVDVYDNQIKVRPRA